MRTALYRFFDDAGSLLYVGITNDLHQRWEGHARDKFWWHLATRIEVIWHKTRDEAEQAERAAIRNETPVYNRTLNNAKIPVQGDEMLPDPFLAPCVESLREGIAAGRYPEGHVFTDNHETALSFEVSPVTFSRALRRLKVEGLLAEGPDVQVQRKRAGSFLVGGANPVLPEPSLRPEVIVVDSPFDPN
ncbi:GIY-YIG nuclease family protein [Streptomyces sp. NPDC095613]|uniref:GIY-YIG nuclease family protein n=1 Tax=Streptomyces sp. NPDC095613 TaxID=3155540 RepID=UPI00332DA374